MSETQEDDDSGYLAYQEELLYRQLLEERGQWHLDEQNERKQN